MSDRIVYGNSHSLNGWPMVDQGSCVWVKVPGTNPVVSLQIREGQPAKILGAFVADWNAYIEHVRDADSACWTPTNSVGSSDHLSGTACDVCWQSHPFKVENAGFNAAQLATMNEMLDFYEDIVWWGNRWRSPKDAMHISMSGSAYGTRDTYGAQNVARVQSFIDRKIRADGFSTFRRDGTVTPPAPPVAAPVAVDVLARATGLPPARAQTLLPTVISGLQAAQCTNAKRIAMWLAQCGHESAGFNATEEYASGAEYEGRCRDLGNCSPGDGVKYKGRTWIQITGKAHYAEFSQWAFSKGLCTSPTQFVDNPTSLGELRWAGIGSAWYWTVSRPKINAMCDAGDLIGVTKAINGGTNGLEDSNGNPGRRTRYNRAMALGDQLLILTNATAPQGDDDLSAEAERKINEMYEEWSKQKKGPSRSFLATDGAAVESPLGFLYNIDGNVWTQQLTWAYLFDVPLAVDVVTSVARNGSYDGSWVKSNEANAWLNEFGQAYCNGLINFKNALAGKLTSKTQAVGVAPVVAAPNPVTNVTNVVDTRALEAEIARLSDQFENLRVTITNPPAPARAEVVAYEDSTGDKIQRAVDSNMDYTDHVLSMDAAKRTALTRALIAIDPSNGDKA